MTTSPPAHNENRGLPEVRDLVLLLLLMTTYCPAEASAWSLRDGWLAADGVAEPLPQPAVNVHLADHGWLLSRDRAAHPRVRRTTAGGFEARYETSSGLLVDSFAPCPELGVSGWRRSLRFTNTTAKTEDMVGAEWLVKPRVTSGGVAWRPPTFRMVEVTGKRMLCVAHWAANEPMRFEDVDGAVRTRIGVAWRLRPGETAAVGHQDIWVASAGLDLCRREARRWYGAHGFTRPVRYPDWLSRCILYEAAAAGHVESRFSDVGGFDAFARQVPYLAELGVTGMWLNAVETHKLSPDPVRGAWNHYDPRDMLAVDPILGGADGFRRLGQQLRDHGIHLLSEIIPHGGHAIQAEKLPAWWTRGRDGKPTHNWGGFGMDNASPQWRAVLRESMAMVSRLAAVEGARIDVADGQGPNWGSPVTGHASLSQIHAGRQVLEAVGAGIREGGCQLPVLIPESPSHPVYFATPGAAVLGYGFETTHFIQNMSASMLLHPAELNRTLRDHFDDLRGSLPAGALTLRTLNNHDTVVAHGRVHLRFGAGLHRALYAVMLSLPGVPMLYQEEEVGSFFALQRLHRARRSLPMLTTAAETYPPYDYFAPEVFSVVRGSADRRVLCLVNLSGEVQRHAAALPAAWSARSHVLLHDAVSGEETHADANGVFEWRLHPYQSAFLCLGFRSRAHRLANVRQRARAGAAITETVANGFHVRHGQVEADLSITGASELNIERSDDGLRVRAKLPPGAPPVVIRWRGARRWAVSGRTALLEDRCLRRHHPFPPGSGYVWRRNHCWGYAPWKVYAGVCPSGRVWQSIFEPLHPDNPALAFADEHELGWAVTEVRTDAANIVLTDCTDEESCEPPRLELRFLATDSDLSPDNQRFGLHQPWRMGKSTPLPRRSLALSFALRTVRGDMLRWLTAPRLPFNPGGAIETRQGQRFVDNKLGIFVVEPGRIAWSRLAPVEGSFRIQFTLRLSERSGHDTDLAEAYRIALDGHPLPFTWTQKNVASTGNAYFAHALTPPVDLAGKTHRLVIETLHTWCAIKPEFRLVEP